jgi:two-component system, OmpR family, sensor histidine kinase CpxA
MNNLWKTPRSIFWKIFLWFWLACLLIVVAVILVMAATEPESLIGGLKPFPLALFLDEPSRCASIYETQGSAGLNRYLSELSKHMTFAETGGMMFDRAYFYSADGTALTKAHPDCDTTALVKQAINSPNVHVQKSFDHIYIANSVAAPSGNRYVFVASTPHDTCFWPINWGSSLRIAAAIIVAAAVCYWLARYVVTPIIQLRAATQDLAAGDLKTRVSQRWLLRRGDEFSQLATDFNEMASRIENLLDAQRRLIADISHELRSPLTRMNVALGLAFRQANPETEPQLKRIEREAKRLNDLIRQMLLLSQLENQPNSQPFQEIDLGRLLHDVVSDADFEARDNDRAARLKRCDPTRIRGIEELLRRALENVVRNAIRYTAVHTDVIVQLIADLSGGVVIQVTDQGPGLPSGEIERVFQPFYRVSEARDRASGGVGLGLAIARRAIEVHGGQIEARNLPKGGLQVEIRLHEISKPGEAKNRVDPSFA